MDLSELADLVAVGRDAWPDVTVDEAAFAEHLAQNAVERGGPSASVHVADLYLAFACARGEPRAMAHLERTIFREVPAFVAHISRDPVFVDELVQALRERLLVGGVERPPRISRYFGRGPLGGWIRVAAVRLALDLRRGAAPREMSDESALAPDAELEYQKSRDGRTFKRAVEDALARLDEEDRTMLRLRYVDGLTVRRIGVVYGVHAATVVRRLATAREQVATRVRALLRERLNLGAAEVEDLAAQIQSRLDLSLLRILGGAGD